MSKAASLPVAASVAWGTTTFPAVALRGSIASSFRTAAALQFAGIELHGDPFEIKDVELVQALSRRQLSLAALATGSRAAARGYCLTSASNDHRHKAEEVLRRSIELASPMGAVVLLGLIVGTVPVAPLREATAARRRAITILRRLAALGAKSGVVLALEPINRYEGNFANTVSQALDALDDIGSEAVGILVDTFHLNIEEASISEAVDEAKGRIAYVQLADSNRKAPGLGHIDFASIVKHLRLGGYSGWMSAEIIPFPTPTTALTTWQHTVAAIN